MAARWTEAEWANFLRNAFDANVRRPLWDFPPLARPAVIHERRVRFGVHDEIGDPEYG